MKIATIFNGELKGSTDAKQLPNQKFNYAYVKGAAATDDLIYWGVTLF